MTDHSDIPSSLEDATLEEKQKVDTEKAEAVKKTKAFLTDQTPLYWRSTEIVLISNWTVSTFPATYERPYNESEGSQIGAVALSGDMGPTELVNEEEDKGYTLLTVSLKNSADESCLVKIRASRKQGDGPERAINDIYAASGTEPTIFKLTYAPEDNEGLALDGYSGEFNLRIQKWKNSKLDEDLEILNVGVNIKLEAKQTKLVATKPGSYFGGSLSLNENGTMLAVGASRENDFNGAGYVYTLSNDKWTLLQPVLSGIDSEARFGTSMSLNAKGTMLAIGAPFATENSVQMGIVYLYALSDGEWTPQQKFSNTFGGLFGTSVSLNAKGNILAIGASDKSYVDVYTLSNGEWINQILFGPSSFGTSVSLNADGSMLAVGAPIERKVYLYTLSNDKWTLLQPELTHTDSKARFGDRVNLSADGSTLVVAAPQGDATGEAAVYLYTLSNGEWTPAQKLLDTELNGSIEISVSLNATGNMLAVGDPDEGGTVYLYTLSNGEWTPQPILSSPVSKARFGINVCLNANGSRLAIGAETDGAAGAAYVMRDVGRQ